MFNTNRIALKGQYKLIVTRKDGVQEVGWFDNLITNIGLDQLGSNVAPAKYARIGDGSTPPLVTDTQLVNQVGVSALGTTSSITPYGYPNHESEIILQYTFTQGQVIGEISEIGIGWQQTGQTLFSRTLITNNDGDPIKLLLTELDQLTVYYKILCLPPTVDRVENATFDLTSTIGYTSRVSTVGSFFNNGSVFLTDGNAPYTVSTSGNQFIVFCAGSILGDITGLPSAPSLAPDPKSEVFNVQSVTYLDYQPGSFYRDVRIEISPVQGNVSGGIQAMVIPFANSYFKIQLGFDTAIAKTDNMAIILMCRVSWYRI